MGHLLPEKEIEKMFVTGLKTDLFREEIYSRSCETLQEAMDESRAEVSTHRNILEITDRVKKADVKKEKRDPPYSPAVVKKTADQGFWRVGSVLFKKNRKLDQCSRYEECGVLSMPQEGSLACE